MEQKTLVLLGLAGVGYYLYSRSQVQLNSPGVNQAQPPTPAVQHAPLPPAPNPVLQQQVGPPSQSQLTAGAGVPVGTTLSTDPTVIIKPWGVYRPDTIPAGMSVAYSFQRSSDSHLHTVGLTYASGEYDICLSATPGDFAGPQKFIGIVDGNLQYGNPEALANVNPSLQPYIFVTQPGVTYYINVRPHNPAASISYWTE